MEVGREMGLLRLNLDNGAFFCLYIYSYLYRGGFNDLNPNERTGNITLYNYVSLLIVRYYS